MSIWKVDSHFFPLEESDLETVEQCADFLESLLHGNCKVCADEDTGELELREFKKLVATIRGLKLHIYSGEHPPPHFHVVTANINASFTIDDCTQMPNSDQLKKSDMDRVLYWHARSKSLLQRVWNETRPTTCVVGPVPVDEDDELMTEGTSEAQ